MGTARVAALLILAVGVIHFALAPATLEEQTYIGVLFVLAGIGSVVAAVGLWFRGDQATWLLGGLVAACTAVGFVLSHTVGLPSYMEEEWSLLGIVSLALEGLYLAVWALQDTVMPSSSTATEYSSRWEPATAAGPRYPRR